MFRNIHFQVIRKVFSNILFLLTASFLVCAALAHFFDEALKPFILSGTISLNDIYIDPNTSGTEDKDKLFINLHIEMEEEGLRIKTFTDKNGQTIEEIIFE